MTNFTETCGANADCIAALWQSQPFLHRLMFMIEPQLINCAQALVALVMLAACEFIGARIFRINLIGAIDRVEQNPMAFSIFTTGRFIGACMVLSAAWTL